MTTTTAPRPRLPRTLAGLASHPWVDSIDDGRGTGDGIAVYLRHGFVWAGITSAVIEPTVKACCDAFRDVAWDPVAWGQACGASAAEVAELTGEATPAPADAAPSPALPGEARPVLPGEATPPPAPSHGEAAPSLPELPRLRADAAAGRPVSLAALARAIAEDSLTPAPSPVSLAAPRLPELCPATPGTPTRAEAVRDVERRDGGGVAVICSGSDREAFRLPDTVSHCGAAAALEAAGWLLSPELEALARRWRDHVGGEDPSAEAVAIAEAAAPLARRFEVFHRTWWRAPGVPGVGVSHHIGWAQTEARARYLCRRWNASHPAGPLSDRAEYTAA